MLYSRGIVMYRPDYATDTDGGTIVCRPEPPAISKRWTPASVLRRDTAAGTFEHVNPRDFSNDALCLQQALIYDGVSARRRVSWPGVALLAAVVAYSAPLVWWML